MNFVVFLTCCLALASAQLRVVWYIKPTADSLCPADVSEEECFTLPQVLNGSLAEMVFSSNTILAFLSGDHVLDFEKEAFLVVRNIENMTLLGSPDVISSRSEIPRPASRILCKSPFAVAFINFSRLAFANITLSGCGANITEELATEAFSTQTRGIHSFGPGQKAALLLINIRTFQMIHCVMDHSLGYGLLGVNVLGDSAISRTVFYGNNNYTASLNQCLFIPSNSDDITTCSGGNAMFVYEDLLECPSNKLKYTLLIQHAVFSLGVNGYGGRLPDTYLTRGAGIALVLAQSSYGVTVTLDNVAFYGNSALIGANIYIAIYDSVDNSTISMQNVISESANSGLLAVTDLFEQSRSSSGGLHLDYNLPMNNEFKATSVCNNKRKYQEEILVITDSRFENNVALLGAGAFLEVRTSTSEGHVARFRIEGCIFNGNAGTSGQAMYIYQQNNIYGRSTSQVTIKNVGITSNENFTPIRNLTEYTNFQLNAIQLINVENVSFTDCVFSENQGSALSAFSSSMHMSGFMTFDKNNGITGGGINMENSQIVFMPHTKITFLHNYALQHGGALNVVGRSDVVFPCFFQINDPTYQPNPNVTLYFEGNYAEDAGSVLFGGSVDRCIVATMSYLFAKTSSEVFDYLVDIGPHSNATSLISSESMMVCVCLDEIPNCTLRDAIVVLPPGATFDFPFVTVGQRSGITPSSVYTVTDPNTMLGQFQQVQEVHKTCTNLNFTIKTTESHSILLVRTSSLEVNGSFTISIAVGECPPGFLLDIGTGECVCDPISQLPGYDSKCDINTQTIHREGGSWVNSSYSGQNGIYDGVIVFLTCPYDYCQSTASDVDLTDPDTQCNFNRTGILCGACKPGLSLTVGSSNCQKCSNKYLALLIGYVLSGFVLVTLLFALDLTITKGTLGGIIFYANIVQANRPFLYPPGSRGTLIAFIAWLNLDAGVDTCLFNGMDGYARNWFGYAFPFYIWIIVLTIIAVSRFSKTVARICGSKSVPVLATLLLLSYNKLLRVSIVSLSSTAIINPDESYRLVWTVDGNVEAWKGKHTILGIAALAVLLLFIVPYTVLLVIVPLSCIQAQSTHRLLSWVNKLKPFMDAHQAPFKNRFRNWTGILLLVRILLTVLGLVNVGEYDSGPVILLIVVLVMFALVAFGWISGGGMYKKWPHNILECSFFLNLGILSTVTLYLGQVSRAGQNAVLQTCGWIALVQCGGIVIYHCYRRLTSFKWLNEKWHKVVRSRTSTKLEEEEATSKGDINSSHSVTTVSFSDHELREPLMDDHPV